MNNHAPAVPVPQLFYLQLPQLPSRATFPPRTTELSAAPVLSCAQYRPAAAFPTSGPVYLRCVTSSRRHSIPTPGQQHTLHCCSPDSRLASPAPGPHHSLIVSLSVSGLRSSPVSSSQPVSPYWSWSVLLHSLTLCTMSIAQNILEL